MTYIPRHLVAFAAVLFLTLALIFSAGSVAATDQIEDRITVVTPSTSGEIFGAESYMITWISTGNIEEVILYYSIDGGNTFTLIDHEKENDGMYAWDVPNIQVSEARIKLVGRDEDGVIRSEDISDASFAIRVNVTEPQDSIEPSYAISVLVTTPSGEEIELHETDKFRGEHLSSVYFLDWSFTRRIYPNELAFLSWGHSFDDVIVIKDEELSKIPFGTRVTIKPGSYLVKIQSNPNVYEVTDGAVLRHVPNEAAAAARYGAEWSTYVRDIPVVFFSDYRIGPPL